MKAVSGMLLRNLLLNTVAVGLTFQLAYAQRPFFERLTGEKWYRFRQVQGAQRIAYPPALRLSRKPAKHYNDQDYYTFGYKHLSHWLAYDGAFYIRAEKNKLLGMLPTNLSDRVVFDFSAPEGRYQSSEIFLGDSIMVYQKTYDPVISDTLYHCRVKMAFYDKIAGLVPTRYIMTRSYGITHLFFDYDQVSDRVKYAFVQPLYYKRSKRKK